MIQLNLSFENRTTNVAESAGVIYLNNVPRIGEKIRANKRIFKVLDVTWNSHPSEDIVDLFVEPWVILHG